MEIKAELGRLAKGAFVAVAGLILIAGGWFAGRAMDIGSLAPAATPMETPTAMPTATATPALAPRLLGVNPDSATTAEVSVTLYIRGENFRETPYVFLTHPTQGEIEGTEVKVYPGGRKARCTFDVSEAEPGVWSVQMINPDGTESELFDAFEIIAPTPTPTATSTPSPTPTATIIIVRPTATPSPTPTATPTARPPRTPPTIPPPTSQP